MNATVVVGVCNMMIIWIIATYIPFGICILRVGSGGAGAGCVVCLRFGTNHNDVNDVTDISTFKFIVNFCNIADFILYLFICKLMTFVKKLIKASAKKFQIWVYRERKKEEEQNVNIITSN